MPALEESLRAVRARIDAAARAAGRDPATVALLAVSKTRPADDVRALTGLGELAESISAFTAERPGHSLSSLLAPVEVFREG